MYPLFKKVGAGEHPESVILVMADQVGHGCLGGILPERKLMRLSEMHWPSLVLEFDTLDLAESKEPLDTPT